MVSMEVAPVMTSSQQVGGSLGALARLGGINVADMTGGAAQFRLFVSALKSRDVSDVLAGDQHLMRGLFPEQWSDADKRWIEPTGYVHGIKQWVTGLLGTPVPPWSPPSGEQLSNMLDQVLEVDDDPKSPIVELRILSPNPEVAQELLSKLSSTIDAQLRKRALDRADDYIAYLNKELGTVTVADYRAALVTHLSEQEQIRMMASANVSFAAQSFSGPSIASEPVAPKSSILLLTAFVLGAIVGGFLAVLAERSQWNAPKFLASVGHRLGASRLRGAG